jgi:hypothetical protein
MNELFYVRKESWPSDASTGSLAWTWNDAKVSLHLELLDQWCEPCAVPFMKGFLQDIVKGSDQLKYDAGIPVYKSEMAKDLPWERIVDPDIPVALAAIGAEEDTFAMGVLTLGADFWISEGEFDAIIGCELTACFTAVMAGWGKQVELCLDTKRRSFLDEKYKSRILI